MFRVFMDSNDVRIDGSTYEILNGLCNYIYVLYKSGLNPKLIKRAIKYSFKKINEDTKAKKNKKVKADIEIHRVNTKNLSKEEFENLITKIIKDC